jgi:4-hydroxybenzoate polyprenyltransferase
MLPRTLSKWFSAFIRLARLGMSPLTVSVPILGAFASGEIPTFEHLLVLGLIGLCAHVFGFVLNDLADLPLDRENVVRQTSPLVTGEISQRTAWLIVLIQPLLVSVLWWRLSGNATGLVLLIMSMALSVLYNTGSKQGNVPRLLAELALAASIGLLCLFGGTYSSSITEQDIAYTATLTLILLLVNSVSSGLKDLKTDQDSGGRSFVLSTGSRMIDDDAMVLSPSLSQYAAAVQIGVGIGFLVLIVQFHPSLLVSVAIIVLGVYAALHLRMLLAVRSFQALRRSLPLLNGYYNYAAWTLLVAHRLPIWTQILLFLFIASLLSVPFRLFLSTWRSRYDVVS